MSPKPGRHPRAPRGGQAGASGAKALTAAGTSQPSPPCHLPGRPHRLSRATPALGPHLEGFVPGGQCQWAHTGKEPGALGVWPTGGSHLGGTGVREVGVCASKATPTNTQCPAGKPTASPLPGGGSGWKLIETGGQPAPCLHLQTWKSGPKTWSGPWSPGPQARPTAVDSGAEPPVLACSGAHSRERRIRAPWSSEGDR